jgi:hypothetical protein
MGTLPSFATALRQRLAAALRQYRSESHLTTEQVVQDLLGRPTKLQRIESAMVPVTGRDLRDLVAEYHIDNAETVEQLRAMAHAAETWELCEDDGSISAECLATPLGGWSYEDGLAESLRALKALIAECARAITLAEEQRPKSISRPSRDDVFRHIYVIATPADRGIRDDLSRLLALCRQAENVSVSVVSAAPPGGLRGPFVLLELENDGDDPAQQLDLLYRQAQQLAFLLALLQVRSWLMLAAELRRCLQCLAFIPFSHQVSARDRIARSSRTLRGPTYPRAIFPARGMAIAA